MFAPWKKSYDKPRQHIKKQRDHFTTKSPNSQSFVFFSSHVWMWELDHKEGWALKSCYFWTVMLEKTLESPVDSKEIKPVNPKRNQPWIFIGKTDAEAEFPILWTPDAESWLTVTDSHAGKGWGQKKGVTGDDVVGWHHRLSGHEFQQTLGDSEGQGSLVRCSPWGHKELYTTQQLNNNNPSPRYTLWLPVSTLLPHALNKYRISGNEGKSHLF